MNYCPIRSNDEKYVESRNHTSLTGVNSHLFHPFFLAIFIIKYFIVNNTCCSILMLIKNNLSRLGQQFI